MSLADDLLSGSRRALARLLTQVENQAPGVQQALATLYPHTGSAHLIGVTGAPGTGKSTLVNQIALTLRERERTVGIVAVDPTSPFSGGAILGDRIRMRDLSGDPGVFIRSMATRGSLGGLARATSDMTLVFDAAGFDVVLIETVGAGQSEVEIAQLAQTICVVEAPGLGDDVQAIKAGILEIADVLAVNKADDPRAKNTVRALRTMLELGTPARQRVDTLYDAHHGRMAQAARPAEATADPPAEPAGWEVPIQQTNALTGDGLPALVDLFDAHRAHLLDSGELTRRRRMRALAELDSRLREALLTRLLAAVNTMQLQTAVDEIVARQLTPQQAVDTLLANADSLPPTLKADGEPSPQPE